MQKKTRLPELGNEHEVATWLNIPVSQLVYLIKLGEVPALACCNQPHAKFKYLMNPLVTQSHIARLASVSFSEGKQAVEVAK